VEESIGRRLRELRGRRSQKAIAELAGITQAYLSRLESGSKRVDSRQLIARLAFALGVAPADVTGEPRRGETDPALQAARKAVPAIRMRLLDTVVGEIDGPTLPMPQLEAQVSRMQQLSHATAYDQLGPMLPGLIGALHTTIAEGGPDRARACELLCLVAGSTCSMLRYLGYADLAWTAAERKREAALASEDPGWIAAAAFTTGHALISAGATARAYAVTSTAADTASRLDGVVGRAPVAGVQGALLLASSFAAAATGRAGEAVQRLDAAAHLAATTGDLGKDAMMFGPTNVGIHRVSVAVESGEGGKVVELGKDVRPEAIDSPIRVASYLTDMARGLATVRGQDQNATGALRRAERIAPQRVGSNVFVRELVPVLLRQARRHEDRRWLHSLEARVASG
jgi:transcriptional regulator with XRE-family HTH domain